MALKGEVTWSWFSVSTLLSPGAVLAPEKVSLDRIFKKQSRYICSIPTERPGHEVLPTRGKTAEGASLQVSKHWVILDNCS